MFWIIKTKVLPLPLIKIYKSMKTIAKKRSSLPEDVAKMQNDLLNLVLKKTGVDYDVLLETAKREFVVSNLDILQPAELQKFKPILL
jgi:hypothetical protein